MFVVCEFVVEEWLEECECYEEEVQPYRKTDYKPIIYICIVSPSILGLIFMGSVMLSICSSSCVLYSAGSGVKRVHVVLSGLRMMLFVRVHVCISCRYDWMFAFAMLMLLCVDVVVMSSA